MFLSMTGANSHLPTLVYQNLSSATHRNGTTDGPGSVDLTRTIQKTISFSSLISSSDPIRIGSGQKDIVKEIVEEDMIYPDEDDGEDMTFFWEALHHCQQLYEQITTETTSFRYSAGSRASLLDNLTVEDLLDWLYRDVSQQLSGYIAYQE
jgi:hypothetical protein